MSALQLRFGQLIAAHRRRRGYTQEQLAERAGASIDTIRKLETGASGASFPMIERIASALHVDPAELFSTEIPSGALSRTKLNEIAISLASLPDSELEWIAELIAVGLRQKG